VTPPDGEWPVADLVLPLPLEVAADVMWALGRLERRGYAVVAREADGLGRWWLRYPATPRDIPPAGNRE
jgi:hypothetical protein